jgi:histidinol-phosphatase (PHP family)
MRKDMMNKIIANYHTHTTVCDGKNTPEETVLAALEGGFTALGFSSHGYTPFDLKYCMHDTDAYISEIVRLKEKYRGKIEIYLGAEEDCRALVDRNRFEYIIGSCHYFHLGEEYLPIDSGVDCFRKCLEAFEFNTHRLAETYYSEFCSYILARKPDIVGHFDLITKFTERGVPISDSHPRYVAAQDRALDRLFLTNAVFEVNTGAMARGYRSEPYPNMRVLERIRDAGRPVVVTTDCHSSIGIAHALDETRERLESLGLRIIDSMDKILEITHILSFLWREIQV